jgi:hypothetical protein
MQVKWRWVPRRWMPVRLSSQCQPAGSEVTHEVKVEVDVVCEVKMGEVGEVHVGGVGEKRAVLEREKREDNNM